MITITLPGWIITAGIVMWAISQALNVVILLASRQRRLNQSN